MTSVKKRVSLSGVHRRFLDAIPTPIFELDKNLIIKSANKEARDKWPEIVEGKSTFGEIFHCDPGDLSIKALENTLKDKSKHAAAIQGDKENQTFFIKSVYLEKNESPGVLVHVDIVDNSHHYNNEEEQKKLEELGISLESRYCANIKTTHTIPWKIDLDAGRFVYLAPDIENILGYPAQSWVTTDDWLSHICDNDRERMTAEIKKHIASCQSFRCEYEITTALGKTLRIRDHISFVKDPRGPCEMMGCMVEMTRCKAPVSALLKEKNKAQHYLDIAGVVIVALNAKQQVELINQKGCHLLGYKEEEIVGKNWFDHFVPPAIRGDVKEAFKYIIKTGDISQARYYENPILTGSGEERMIAWYNTFMKDENGKITGTLSSGEDITEKKNAEFALRESEERYRSLQQNIPVGLFRSTPKGGVMSVNPAFLKMFKVESFEKLRKMGVENFYVDPARREQLVKILREKGVVTEFEAQLRRADGTTFIGLLSIKATFDDNGELVFMDGTLEDISQRRKLEEELKKTEKLESLGLLAGGIAHDFNNILSSVLVNIVLSKGAVVDDPKTKTRLYEAERAINRAKGLTRQLLTFAKGGAPVKSTASIRDLLMEITEFALSGAKVRCHYDLVDDLWDADIDEAQVSQVFQNLILNAAQAMPQGGTIHVEAHNLDITGRKEVNLPPGPYIQIVIRDEGIGIPEEHLTKIFDPFFSTKQKGSGLGLATAYSIIGKHNGLIDVTSELGKGTSFYVYLPASLAKAQKKEELKDSLSPGQGKILLMDDEEIVLESTSDLLQEMGYQVILARGGSEAIELYKEAWETGNPFDMVLLDLVIPGDLGAQETLEELQKIDPDVKAVVSSGYSTDPVLSDYQKFGFIGAVSKPYKINDINQVLKRAFQK